MRNSRVLGTIRSGRPAFGVSLHLGSPDLFEMTSLMGFDAIWLDLEHHSCSLESAFQLIQASRVGNIDIIARPAKGEFMRLSRLLEAGATGIMYPRCNSPEEAAEVVNCTKFAPLGKRGFDGSGPDASYLMTPMNEYLQVANERTFIIIQIEEPDTLQHAEAIAAVPGVDMLMLGPADFSILAGIPGQFDHELIEQALETVAQAAKNAGKNWAATCGSIAQAKRMVDRGARLIFHGCDIVYVKQGLEKLLAELTGTFPKQAESAAPQDCEAAS